MESILKEEGYPIALLPTLLVMAKGSVGSNEYASLYVQKNGSTYDAIKKGRFACALFVSSQLDRLRLIQNGIHTNVKETEEDLLESGWYRIDSPIPGAVVIWTSKMASDKRQHRHIGICLSHKRVVSTNGVSGIPIVHHVTYGTRKGRPVRPIEVIYFHDKLLSSGD